MTSNTAKVDAVIVGAGISGLYQLYKLRNLGLTTRVYEAGDDVGGTWYWNRYPGLRCDISSMLYSYSFSPELEQEWNWTEKYATQPEILRYVNHVADRFDLRKDITFSTRVVSAVYDEVNKLWQVTTDTGEVVETQFLIMATGVLSAPKKPDIAGIEKFRGSTYHTAQWPREDVDFAGKRLAVIGTGSSGVQSIPILAQRAADMTVFQRTPCFTIPAGHRPLTEKEVADMKANYQEFHKLQHKSRTGVLMEPPSKSALEVTEEERNAAFQAAYETGCIFAIGNTFHDIRINKAANEMAAEFLRQKIQSVVRDPEVAESLSPRTFPYGTKRICLDTKYYETFNLPHVHLVDLRKTPLVEITETGVRTSEKEYEVDAIVFATGFDAITGALTRIDIQGKGGVSLKHKWAEQGPRSYISMAISGFPNLFVVTGPLGPGVFSVMTMAIEHDVNWITDCIRYLREQSIAEIEAMAEAEDEWAEFVVSAANKTLFPLANSWYMGANVPNKPRGFMAYVGGFAEYKQKCDEVAQKGYEGFAMLSPIL